MCPVFLFSTTVGDYGQYLLDENGSFLVWPTVIARLEGLKVWRFFFFGAAPRLTCDNVHVIEKNDVARAMWHNSRNNVAAPQKKENISLLRHRSSDGRSYGATHVSNFRICNVFPEKKKGKTRKMKFKVREKFWG